MAKNGYGKSNFKKKKKKTELERCPTPQHRLERYQTFAGKSPKQVMGRSVRLGRCGTRRLDGRLFLAAPPTAAAAAAAAATIRIAGEKRCHLQCRCVDAATESRAPWLVAVLHEWNGSARARYVARELVCRPPQKNLIAKNIKNRTEQPARLAYQAQPLQVAPKAARDN